MKAKTWKEKFNKRHGFPLNQSNSVRTIARLNGISMTNANKIIQKGKGAFYNNPGSVRPQVKSATQWAIARLYSAVMGGPAAKVDKDLLK